MYSTFNKINGYTEDYIGNECLTLTPLDKNKLENVKKHHGLPSNNRRNCNTDEHHVLNSKQC